MGLHIMQLVLAAGGAVLATKLVPRNSSHRPLAWYLGVAVAFDLVRLWLQQFKPTEPAIREGTALYLRHVDQAIYVALIAALPAMAMALFLRRRPWLIGIAGAGLWCCIVAGYPELRGAELMWLYTGLELAGALASVGFFFMWLLRSEGSWASTPVLCGLALISASLTSVVLPPLVGDRALAQWPVIVALHAVSLGLVLVLQLRALMTPAQAPRGRS